LAFEHDASPTLALSATESRGFEAKFVAQYIQEGAVVSVRIFGVGECDTHAIKMGKIDPQPANPPTLQFEVSMVFYAPDLIVC
jgi:hypothetical protein